ncbi:hypothetical protein [Methylobacterium sp.]|uniref:hypothetical protein n=1 Tax=Methylobacterium sp. TaxID=409 RepID=UPI0025D6A8F4|nr:hypothetical protein [Methylobacterium sp.]MBY0257747.1 hypothetical protein [Methylobacterium sp.]
MSRALSIPAALPLQTRLAPLKSVGTANRTIEVIFTTGAAVRRRAFDGCAAGSAFDEVLLVSDAAIDLSRLKSGAPVLDSHQTGTVDAQRAVVDDAWIVGGKGYARLRFPEVGTDAASDRLFEKARQKIVRNISVGYAINRVRIVDPRKAGDVEQRIVERWTPYELSFVTVPADAGAQTRSRGCRTFPVVIAPPDGGLSLAEACRLRMRMRSRLVGL